MYASWAEKKSSRSENFAVGKSRENLRALQRDFPDEWLRLNNPRSGLVVGRDWEGRSVHFVLLLSIGAQVQKSLRYRMFFPLRFHTDSPIGPRGRKSLTHLPSLPFGGEEREKMDNFSNFTRSGLVTNEIFQRVKCCLLFFSLFRPRLQQIFDCFTSSWHESTAKFFAHFDVRDFHRIFPYVFDFSLNFPFENFFSFSYGWLVFSSQN